MGERGGRALYAGVFRACETASEAGRLVTQWVPLYESTPEVVKSEMATFFAVFPDGLAWVNDREGGGDIVLFGRADPAAIDVDKVSERFGRVENARVAKSLRDLGFVSAIDLLSSYAGYGPDFAAWLKGPPSTRTAICIYSTWLEWGST